MKLVFFEAEPRKKGLVAFQMDIIIFFSFFDNLFSFKDTLEWKEGIRRESLKRCEVWKI